MLPAIPDCPDGENHFTHFFHRLFPLDAEAPLVMSLDLRAESENEPALRKPSKIPGEVSQNRRAARESHGDTRPDAQSTAVLRSQHKRQERLVGGLESPDSVKTYLVGKARQRRHLLQVVNEQTRVKLHRCTPQSKLPQAVLD